MIIRLIELYILTLFVKSYPHEHRNKTEFNRIFVVNNSICNNFNNKE